MELKEGMYVRTKWGIAKIREIEVVEEILGREVQPITIYYVDRCFQPIDETKCFKEDIAKASNNIIDLIEVGDYVNGYKVIKIGDLSCYDNRIGSKYIEIDFNVENDNEHWCEDTTLQNPDIKSMVTKEQFESMSYKVN